MAQPTAYVPATAFLGFELAQPQLPGQEIDAELRQLRTTTDQILENLALIQRDDTELGNETVGIDQLKPELQLILGVQAGSLVDIIGDFLIANPVNLATQVTGALQAANFPALTGDITTPGGSLATALATVNANVGSFGSTSLVPIITVDAKGRITAVSTVGVTATASSAAGSLTGTTLAANVLASSLTSVGVLTGGSTGAGFTVALSTATVTGTLAAARMPALTGDIATSAGAVATTLATVNSNVGSFGGASSVPAFTVNAKGLITAASATAVVAPAGTLSGATLAAGVTASSLTSLGVLTGAQIAASGYLNFDTTAGSGGYGLRDNTGTVQVKNSGGSWVNIPTSGLTQWTTASSDIYFSTGLVGVGTTAPAAVLHAKSAAAESVSGQEVLRLQGLMTGGTTGAGPFLSFDNGGAEIGRIASVYGAGIDLAFSTFNGSALAEMMRIKGATGNVGIGVAAPTVKLDARSASAATAAILSAANSDLTSFVSVYSGKDTLQPAIIFKSTTSLRFGVGDHEGAVSFTEYMRISSAGKVGIGTASPSRALHVASQDPGILLQNTGAGAQQWLLATATLSANDGIFSIYDAALGARLSIAPTTGFVGIANASPTVRLDVTGDVKWSGDATSIGNVLVKGGRPWTDVTAWGAVSGTTDSRDAIQNAIDYVSATYGGGLVVIPQGNYRVTSTMTVPASVTVLGMGQPWINTRPPGGNPSGADDLDIAVFVISGTYAKLENLSISGGGTAAAVNPVLTVNVGVVSAVVRDCKISGGGVGISANGTDCLFENVDVNTAGSGVNSSNIVSTGQNWYVRCKIDTVNAVKYGFWQQWNGSLTEIAENHFEQCDFSGQWTGSAVRINDGGRNSNITVFSGCVFGGGTAPSLLLEGTLWTSFVGCEIGLNISSISGPCSVVGCYGVGGTISATGCKGVGAGNVNITGLV